MSEIVFFDKSFRTQEIIMWRQSFSIGFLALALTTAGCEGFGNLGGSAVSTQPIASNVNGSGTIQSIEQIPRQQGLGLGTLAGAAVGGIIGNQIGGGSGQTVTTAAGAAGGAYLGHEIEKRRRAGDQIYKVTIRMDDGTTQSFAQEAAPTVRQGDRVMITNGVLSPL
jgi:outer membrane lipoprotein SlyB